MPKIINKETHVFLKTEDSFTAISKRKTKGVYQAFTNLRLTPGIADTIERLFPELTVKEINFEKGFIFFKIAKEKDYRSIVQALKLVLYG